MAAPYGWVSPRWAALGRRPLILGLPYSAAFVVILLFVYVAAVLKLVMPAIVALLGIWTAAAAITLYDSYGLEQLIAAARMPRVLRVS